MVKKRFFIGFNGILLTLLYVLGLYFSFLLFEVIFYLILKHRRNKQVLEQVL